MKCFLELQCVALPQPPYIVDHLASHCLCVCNLSFCIFVQAVELSINQYLPTGCWYLSMFCRWHDRARRSCAQHRGSTPEDTTGGNGLLFAGR